MDFEIGTSVTITSVPEMKKLYDEFMELSK